jgi:hypothetical protein
MDMIRRRYTHVWRIQTKRTRCTKSRPVYGLDSQQCVLDVHNSLLSQSAFLTLLLVEVQMRFRAMSA